MKDKNMKVALVLVVLSAAPLFAKGAGTSGGLTLVQPYGARASALGEAFTAATNDISAFGYNPASLQSLEGGQASFVYQKGLIDDAFGQFLIGTPVQNGSWGLSVGYYNSGDIELFDGATTRTVKAQTDLVVSLGRAVNFGQVSVGLTGKYLRSELIETESATAFAADLGLSLPISTRLRMGMAAQNFGTQLKYVEQGDNLPRILRTGFSYALGSKSLPTSLLLDVPYHVNEQEYRPSLGLEMMFGPLAMRAGYRTGSELQEFSIGTGLVFNRSSVDYSFGMINQLESQHRISYSMRFAGLGSAPLLVKQDKQEKKKVEEIAQTPAKPEAAAAATTAPTSRYSLANMKGSSTNWSAPARQRSVYIVAEGDTLASIAKKQYGKSTLWETIYNANRHLIENPRELEVGQKIIIP